MRGPAWEPADFGWTPVRGVWLHAGARQIATYCEGDVSIATYPSDAAYREAIAHAIKFYEDH
jgi:hypothetical protein